MSDSAASRPFADPADQAALWEAALLRCPYCGALVLPADIAEHGAAHRRHDAEHDAFGHA